VIATAEEISMTRQKFYNAAKEMYPNVGEPGTVWVLTEVLGWPWVKVTNVSIDGFGRQGYRIFRLDSTGNKIMDPHSSEPMRVTRRWTKEELRELRDWWWLLGL
jgi:hypothetical protein